MPLEYTLMQIWLHQGGYLWKERLTSRLGLPKGGKCTPGEDEALRHECGSRSVGLFNQLPTKTNGETSFDIIGKARND